MKTSWSSNTPLPKVQLTDFISWFFHIIIEVIQFILFSIIKQYQEVTRIHDTIVYIIFYSYHLVSRFEYYISISSNTYSIYR